MKIRCDMKFYHIFVDTIARLVPSQLLGIIGRIMFNIMLLYLKFYSFITGEARERLIEYTWVLNEIKSGYNCLNVGCGDSLLDYEMADRFIEYISIDIHPYPIAQKKP